MCRSMAHADGSFICLEKTMKPHWNQIQMSSYQISTMPETKYKNILCVSVPTCFHPWLKVSTGTPWILAGVNIIDYLPLIHLASGSWTVKSGLKRSSTDSLVLLPAWLSAAKTSHSLLRPAFCLRYVYHICGINGFVLMK